MDDQSANPSANFNNNPPATPTYPEPAPAERKPSKKKWFIIGGIVFLLVAWQVTANLLGSSSSNNKSAAVFYEALQNASQKTKVHFAQHQQRYENEAALTSKGKPIDELKLLTERDVASGEYSTLFAGESSFGGTAERCVKGKEYRPSDRNTDTLQAAMEALKGPAAPYEYLPTQSATFSPCNFNRVGHKGKFSDGVLPIGLTASQSTSWINYYKMREPMKITDDGQATVGKFSGRKFSFVVGEKATGKPYTTDAFFYAYRDGDTGKPFGLGIPLEKITNNFERLFENPSGITGFYLIDEKTKLPVYSEMTTTSDGATGDFKPYVSKQHYSFPETLTIDEKTQLEEF